MEATIPEAIGHVTGVLAGGAVTVLTAILLGRIALGQLSSLRARTSEAEGWLLAFAVGSAALSTLVFVICSLGWLFDVTVWIVLLATAACWLRWGRWHWEPQPVAPEEGTQAWKLLVVAPAAVYGVLYAVHTLAPETRTDAMGYHLGLVQRYYRAHGFVPFTTNVYAQISQGAEMLYLLAYSIGRESAAKVVHFSFLVATAGAILSLARRFRARLAGAFAAVVFFTCPVVIPDATSAYNDIVLAFTLFAVFYVVVLSHGQWNGQWFLVLGTLVGFAFGVKYTGVIALAAPMLAALAIIRSTGRWKLALQCLLLAGLPAAATGLPWLAKSAVITGNPLAPFFNSWFPNPYVSVEWERAYTFAMRAYQEGPLDRWQQLLAAPADLVWGERYAGSLGWMVLLVPLSLLAWRRQPARWLLTAAAICALPWLSNAGARFLIPSLAFALVATGLALESIPRRWAAPAVGLLLAAQCLTSWPMLRERWYYGNLWTAEGFPWRAALGLEPAKWHLARNVEFFLLADHLDRIGSPDTRVLSVRNLPEAYFQAELLVSYQGLENQDLADALLNAAVPAQRPENGIRVNWPRQALRGMRARQLRSHDTRSWILSEIRLLRDGAEVDLGVDLIAWADPLRWHAPRLWDGNLFTAWNSREPLRAGMTVEVRLPRPVDCDGLELVFPRSAATGQAPLQFSGLGEDEEWTELQPQGMELVQWTLSREAAARAANAALRRSGIDYVVLVLDPTDPYYPQTKIIASEPGTWGLRRAFVDRAAVLYEVLEPGGDFR